MAFHSLAAGVVKFGRDSMGIISIQLSLFSEDAAASLTTRLLTLL